MGESLGVDILHGNFSQPVFHEPAQVICFTQTLEEFPGSVDAILHLRGAHRAAFDEDECIGAVAAFFL